MHLKQTQMKPPIRIFCFGDFSARALRSRLAIGWSQTQTEPGETNRDGKLYDTILPHIQRHVPHSSTLPTFNIMPPIPTAFEALNNIFHIQQYDLQVVTHDTVT